MLVFVEVCGPLTGNPADADPAHRHAVRLSRTQAFDGATPLTDPLTEEAITEIEWPADDAPPFPVCVSAITEEDHGAHLVEDVSIVLGNIVLCDHGRTVTGEALGAVPPPRLRYPARRHGSLLAGAAGADTATLPAVPGASPADATRHGGAVRRRERRPRHHPGAFRPRRSRASSIRVADGRRRC